LRVPVFAAPSVSTHNHPANGARRFEREQVSITSGEDSLQWYESSPGAQRGFCRQCGSSMFFRSRQWAGELHVALACIDDAIDREPEANAFFDRHIDWMPIDTSLKQLDG